MPYVSLATLQKPFRVEKFFRVLKKLKTQIRHKIRQTTSLWRSKRSLLRK